MTSTKTAGSVQEWPSYCAENLQNQLQSIKGSYKTSSVQQFLERIIEAQSSLIFNLSQTSEDHHNNFWVVVGYPAIISAFKFELQLRKFYEALTASDFSRITSHHPVCPGAINVYRRDPGGPTGVLQSASILPRNAEERARVQELIKEHNTPTYPGGRALQG